MLLAREQLLIEEGRKKAWQRAWHKVLPKALKKVLHKAQKKNVPY